ncbi:MAG: ribose-phosphate pyrophosphokinase [Lachnospiraceae bacterium]|nr:ribose-phosphate pyrophosphokinase [Lachnospiraceae bacterium]
MSQEDMFTESISYGPLGIIAMDSSKEMGQKVDAYISGWRKNRKSAFSDEPEYHNYQKDSYLIKASCPRFGTGEAKGVIGETVRGKDIFIILDVCNYNLKYTVCGHENCYSPDDHFQDLKRIIAAISGHARRITVIMPFLYESRQHKRSSRESLDCAIALQELVNMGVDSIITFDAHDPRVQNSIPFNSFENVPPTYQFIKALVNNVPDLKLNPDELMVISPDEGATGRAVYLATVLGANMGMFYKRRDYTKVVNGRNPIVAHEFLGADVTGKDVIILDDMISSGESMIDTANALKARNAGRIFVCSTFGLFTGGLDAFDKAYADGTIYRVVTTDLIYQKPELLAREWYISAGMSKYVALLIDALNHDASISEYLSPTKRIHDFIDRVKAERENK